jgi:hypothetical protein
MCRTPTSAINRPVALWAMQDRYAESVKETLESTFGELEEKQDICDRLNPAAAMPWMIISPDYLSDLMYLGKIAF